VERSWLKSADRLGEFSIYRPLKDCDSLAVKLCSTETASLESWEPSTRPRKGRAAGRVDEPDLQCDPSRLFFLLSFPSLSYESFRRPKKTITTSADGSDASHIVQPWGSRPWLILPGCANTHLLEEMMRLSSCSTALPRDSRHCGIQNLMIGQWERLRSASPSSREVQVGNRPQIWNAWTVRPTLNVPPAA
jgi:hypothetical protein